MARGALLCERDADDANARRVEAMIEHAGPLHPHEDRGGVDVRRAVKRSPRRAMTVEGEGSASAW